MRGRRRERRINYLEELFSYPELDLSFSKCETNFTSSRTCPVYKIDYKEYNEKIIKEFIEMVNKERFKNMKQMINIDKTVDFEIVCFFSLFLSFLFFNKKNNI